MFYEGGVFTLFLGVYKPLIHRQYLLGFIFSLTMYTRWFLHVVLM